MLFDLSLLAQPTPAGAAPPRVPPTISTYSLSPEGTFTVGGSGQPGQTYILQAASDPALPGTWISLATNVAGAGGVFSFTDPQATNSPRRFYRTVTP